jgi:hypothetical protein
LRIRRMHVTVPPVALAQPSRSREVKHGLTPSSATAQASPNLPGIQVVVLDPHV